MKQWNAFAPSVVQIAWREGMTRGSSSFWKASSRLLVSSTGRQEYLLLLHSLVPKVFARELIEKWYLSLGTGPSSTTQSQVLRSIGLSSLWPHKSRTKLFYVLCAGHSRVPPRPKLDQKLLSESWLGSGLFLAPERYGELFSCSELFSPPERDGKFCSYSKRFSFSKQDGKFLLCSKFSWRSKVFSSSEREEAFLSCSKRFSSSERDGKFLSSSEVYSLVERNTRS